jgi:hypothetical protein
VLAAGLRYSTGRDEHRRIRESDLKADLLRVEKLVGHPPSPSEYKSHGKYSVSPYHRVAASSRWKDVLVYFLSISDDDAWYVLHRNNPGVKTQKELLSKIRQIAAKLGRPPNCTETHANGIDPQTLKDRLRVSKWGDVLRVAGLNVKRMRRTSIARNMSNEEIFEDLIAVARKLGRFPHTSEYNKLGAVRYEAVYHRLGWWSHLKRQVEERLGWLKLGVSEIFRPIEDTLGNVEDPTRDFLTHASVEEIREQAITKNS